MRKSEQTRQEIIRKAAPIFNQKGYDGAAPSDLMRATGLEKGGIYRHFASKQELVGEAFDHAWKLAMDTRFEGQAQLRAEATVVQRGHTIGYAECNITDEQDRLIARAASTCMVLRGQKALRR